ncbi:MAG TPA: polysaccharide deacetylase family protein [Melioribacteraceae bacterium]|nr:polysaccharide deacetylase family protein [Melioribacteraceae bacterium]
MNKFLFLSLLYTLTTSGQTKNIAITIDDLPLNRIIHYDRKEYGDLTDRLLNQLVRQGAPVIGFVNEDKLYTDGSPDSSKTGLLTKWLDAGFELGNHTYGHQSANRIPPEEFIENIKRGEIVTRKLMNQRGKQLRFFRHPFLHTGTSLETKNRIESFLKESGYTVAPVSVDNSEWIFAAAYEKVRLDNNVALMKYVGEEYIRYMKEKLLYWEEQAQSLFGRDISHILLIHANSLNADYYHELCEMIRSLNYKFISLEEALKDPAYETADRFIKNNGISWIHRWAITAGKKRDFFGNEPTTPQSILDLAGIESE